jgi:hypothetical protein
MIHSMFLGVLKTQCIEEVRQAWIITKYIHDEYCDTLLTFSTCNTVAGTAAQEYALRYPDYHHPNGYVFMVVAAPLWDRKCNAYGTWERRSPTDCTDTSQWRRHNCSCRTRAREKLMQHNTKIRTAATGGPQILCNDQLHPYQYSQSALLFPDNHSLWMQCCKWLWH